MKNRVTLLLLVLALAFVLAGCQGTKSKPAVEATPQPAQPTAAPAAPGAAAPSDAPSVAAAFQKGGCGACHVIPGIPNAAGTIGPDLSKIGETAGATLQDKAYTGKAKDVAGYIHEAIVSPMRISARAAPAGAARRG